MVLKKWLKWLPLDVNALSKFYPYEGMNANTVTLFTTILVFIGLVGGGAAFFGKSRGDSIIKYQTNEITLRDGTITRLEKDVAALTSENKVLKDQNNKLGELAQGSPQLETLTKAVENLTKVVKAKL